MFTVTVPELKEYKICELFYKFKYVDELPPQKGSHHSDAGLLDRYEETLKRVITHFFYKRQGYQTPTYNNLLTRWEKLWFPKGTDAYTLTTERHNPRDKNLASYTSEAATALLEFYRAFEKSKEQPLLIKEDFLVPLDKDIRLAGSFDLVLGQRDEVRVLLFSARQTLVKSHFIIDFAAQQLALNHRNKKPSKVKYQLYHLAGAKPGPRTHMPTREHGRMLRYWAKHMSNNELFIPRRGDTIRCKGCPFDDACKGYHHPDL